MLNWGFGVEKEFPILIGTFYKYELIKVLDSCLQFFDSIFLRNEKDYLLIKNEIDNIRTFLSNNIDDTKILFKEDNYFYINLYNIIETKIELTDCNIYIEHNEDFIFQSQDQENGFVFYYESLIDFLIKDFEYSDSILGIYIRLHIFKYIRQSFIDYYENSISYITDGIAQDCYDILDILYNIYEENDNYESTSYDGVYIIYNKNINLTSVNQYVINTFDLELDSGGFEVKTNNFKNITIPECVKELDTTINEVYNIINNQILTRIDKQNNKKIIMCTDYASYYLPCLDDIETCFYTIIYEQVYSGETELNITLPYNTTTSIEELVPNFKHQHIQLMKSLRILSPLFFAILTGVQYFSFNDNNTIPETSFRFKKLGYRMFTTLDLNSIYDLDNFYTNYQNKCLTDIFRKKGIPFRDGIGIQEFSVNRNDIKYDPDENKFFGFEWKVLDQYPTKYINNIGLFIILLSQWINNKNIIIDDTLNCEKHKVFLEDIIFQGWNTILSNDYFIEICHKLQLTNLDYDTLNKYKIIQTCSNNNQLNKNKIIDIIIYKKYSSLSKNKLRKLKTKQLLHILCTKYKFSKPTCYSFLQSIFHYLYQYFIKNEFGENIDIINSFFPDFQTNKYSNFNFIPNINLFNYNKMLDDYKQFHYKDYLKNKKKVQTDIHNSDYDDLYFYNKN